MDPLIGCFHLMTNFFNNCAFGEPIKVSTDSNAILTINGSSNQVKRVKHPAAKLNPFDVLQMTNGYFIEPFHDGGQCPGCRMLDSSDADPMISPFNFLKPEFLISLPSGRLFFLHRRGSVTRKPVCFITLV